MNWATILVCAISCHPIEAANHVVAWGDNSFGKTNVPAAATDVWAIAAGHSHSLALKADGTVIGWGRAPAATVPTGLSNVVAISAGRGQSLALKADGALAAWGAPTSQQTTNIPPGLTNVVAIACGDDHNLVLRGDGTVFAWGANYSGQTILPADLSNVVAIAVGNTGNLAIRSDGTVWGSGMITNRIGALSNLVAGAIVADGNFQGAVVRGDGTAFAWGYPASNLTTNIPNVIAVSARSGFNQAGGVWFLHRDRTLSGLGSQYLGQTNVYESLSNVLAVTFGYSHHLAIVGDGWPLPIEPALDVSLGNDRFTILQQTARGRSYRAEYKDMIGEIQWQMLTPVRGDGTIRPLIDPNATGAQRFYRIRVAE